MTIIESTRKYEAWLKKSIPTVADDFDLKHKLMAENPFSFFRATFYRWVEYWDTHCKVLHNSPKVLAVGDLHFENFGTWRDQEGRLVWGVNDFDEAYRMPYLLDIVRLAASLFIAIDGEHLKTKHKEAFAALIEGYEHSLTHDGLPFILEERHQWLRDIATERLKNAPRFWEKCKTATTAKVKISGRDRKLLINSLPKEAEVLAFGHRSAGLGSLGRTRTLVLADLHGGLIARETKPLAASAYARFYKETTEKFYYERILKKAVRVSDPFLNIDKNYVIRRISPHCSKIELSALPKKVDELQLIFSMGVELGNIHCGSDANKKILRDLEKRSRSKIQDTIKATTQLVAADWKIWKNSL